MLLEDAFGLSTRFVWLENFERLFGDPNYLNAVRRSRSSSARRPPLAMASGSRCSSPSMADRVIQGPAGYKTLLIGPYAVAPAVAGVLWLFMFNPSSASSRTSCGGSGYAWNHQLNGGQALLLVVSRPPGSRSATTFSSFSPGSRRSRTAVIEAAAIDGAGPATRFWRIIFPAAVADDLLPRRREPRLCLLRHLRDHPHGHPGGPAKATETLVYKVFNDGFIGLDLGGSAAQSVILMAIVIGLTVVQFRYIERRVRLPMVERRPIWTVATHAVLVLGMSSSPSPFTSPWSPRRTRPGACVGRSRSGSATASSRTTRKP